MSACPSLQFVVWEDAGDSHHQQDQPSCGPLMAQRPQRAPTFQLRLPLLTITQNYLLPLQDPSWRVILDSGGPQEELNQSSQKWRRTASKGRKFLSLELFSYYGTRNLSITGYEEEQKTEDPSSHFQHQVSGSWSKGRQGGQLPPHTANRSINWSV